jgi:hypothetical protein
MKARRATLRQALVSCNFVLRLIGGHALTKTINGLFKAEMIHRRGPRPSAEAIE